MAAEVETGTAVAGERSVAVVVARTGDAVVRMAAEAMCTTAGGPTSAAASVGEVRSSQSPGGKMR
jgi:hypothetical protein